MNVHAENLQRICRICFEFLGKDKYVLHNLKNRLANAFFINFNNELPLVHPSHICHKCYCTLCNIEKKSTTSTLAPHSWKAHSEGDCELCNKVATLKKGGRRPKRAGKAKGGRPSNNTKDWSQSVIKTLDEITPPDIIPPIIFEEDFHLYDNPHLNLCKCKICKGIVRRPILTECNHLYCFNCMVTYLRGKDETNSICPECNTKILQNTLISPKHINDMLKVIQIKCKNNCKNIFTIQNYENYKEHEINCTFNKSDSTSFNKSDSSSNSLTLSDIMNFSPDSQISRDMEEAALKIIKNKFTQSSTKTIEFKTGGPRVSFALFFHNTCVTIQKYWFLIIN